MNGSIIVVGYFLKNVAKRIIAGISTRLENCKDSDIYTCERWGDPQSSEHLGRTGEVTEITNLWKSLQPRLVLYVLHHPHFLRKVPACLRDFLRRPFSRYGRRSASAVVVEKEWVLTHQETIGERHGT